MPQLTNETDMLVAIGRIEAKLDATLPEHAKALEANTMFQQTAMATFAEHETQLKSHQAQINEIRDNLKSQFTKSTVLIGLVLTAVNIVIGLLGA